MNADDGRILGRFGMRIELGKLREFARATGASNETYFATDTPPIPPTFLTTASFWQPEEMPRPYEALAMDLKRVLHGEQQYSFFGADPIRAGDVLEVEVRIESVESKEGKRGGTMRLAYIVTDFRNPAGELVAQGRSTTLETGSAAR